MAFLNFERNLSMRIPFLVLLFFQGLIGLAQDIGFPAFLLDKGLLENANAVVRLDQMDLHIASSKEMTYTVQQAVTVLNKLGDSYARTHVFYDKESKVKNIEAFVYDKNGKELDHIKRKDFKDVSAADGFSLYIDDRLLQYRYTPVQYPYTLLFTYEIETSDTGAFPPWYFLSNYLVSVEKSRYTISYAQEDLKPVIKEYNLEGLQVSKSELTGEITYEADHIHAIKEESLSPDFQNLAPRLSVRLQNFHYKGKDVTVNNWNDLGLWINNSLLAGRDELPEGTVHKVRAMVEGVTDDLEKAKIIYKYVQENTRYISVQIGIGGLQPISAIEVDRVKYGDCKGLSNYTKALLQAVGVEAYYTVIEAGSSKVDFDGEFADLGQGNHAILTIPYKDTFYWIDCTSQTLPFGYVGEFTDDRMALIVTPNGGQLIKTVAYLNQDNLQDTKAFCTISQEGAIQAEATIETRGSQYYRHFLLEGQNNDDIKKYYSHYWNTINNLNIKTFDFKNDKDKVAFNEKIAIDAVKYASISGERMLFAANPFNQNTFVPDRYRTRNQPFEIRRGFMDTDEFEIKIPAGYHVEAMPGSDKIDTEFGHYQTVLAYDEVQNIITYKREFLLKEGLYPKEKYEAYRDFRKKVSSKDTDQIVLIRNSQ